MGVVIPNLLTEDRVSGAQIIDGSLKFDDAKKQHLTWTPSTSGNRGVWTISFWAKLNRITGYQYFFSAGTNLSSNFMIFQQDNGASTVAIYDYTSSFQWFIDPVDVFRDPSAWYHFLINLNTPNQSVNFYVNNRLVGQVNTSPSSNYQGFWNHNVKHRISDDTYSIGCQLSQFYNIDGQALGPEYFGYTDPLTNTWRPKKFSGNFFVSGTLSYNATYGSNVTEAELNKMIDGNASTYGVATSGTAGFIGFEYPNSAYNTIKLKLENTGGGSQIVYIQPWVGGSSQNAGAWEGLTGNGLTISAGATVEKNFTFPSGYDGYFRLYLGDSPPENIRVYDISAYTTNNSFYLPLDGNTPIGQDQSGRGNNWTPVNFGGSNTLEKATGALPILNTDGGGKVARVGVRTDSNFSNLKLAVPFVGVATDVVQQINGNSASMTSFTANNATFAVHPTAGAPYGTGLYLNSVSDYPNINYTAGTFNFLHNQTGSGTVEFWMYNGAYSTEAQAFGNLAGSPDIGFQLYMSSSSSIAAQIARGVTGSTRATGSASVPQNAWSHIAVTKTINGSNAELRLYVNGVLSASNTSITASDLSNSNSTYSYFRIGQNIGDETARGWTNYYMNDLRIYDTVKYTQNFIPASTDPDILPDTPSGVSYSSNVSLVPSTDGAVAFDGSGDNLTTANSTDYAFGTGDYTVETFVYLNSTSGNQIFVGNWTSGTGWQLYFTTTGNKFAWYVNSGILLSSNLSPSAGKWYHVAVSRTGTTFRMFIDGVLDNSTTDSTNYSTTQILEIGYQQSTSTNYLNGFLSNVHIVKGTALYTSNFTPPTAPITPVANTKLLCCKSQVYQNVGDVGVTTSWSNYTSCPAGFYSGNPVYNMFDGSTSTSAQSGGTVGDNGIITFTPPSPIVYSNTLRVYTDNGNYNLNGTGWSGTMDAGWYTITSSGGGTLTSLAFRWYNQPAGGYVNVMAIEVDGTILTDGIITKGNTAATNFNPFTANINAVRGQESGYATLNPLTANSAVLSQGNLRVVNSTNATRNEATIAVTSGKWYWEGYAEANMQTNTIGGRIAICVSSSKTDPELVEFNIDWHATSGLIRRINGATSTVASGVNYNDGDLIGVALDADRNIVYFYKNGILVYSYDFSSYVTIGSSPLTAHAWGFFSTTWQYNFGQKPFKFPPPAGFQPLALANTPRPTIVRPDQYVGIATWVGNYPSSTNVNIGWKPDFVWLKSRTNATANLLFDTIRGATYYLSSNATDAESNSPSTTLTSFNNNGFTVGDNSTANGGNMVAWAWKAGGNSNTFNIDDVGYATASAAGLTAGTITPTGASVNTKSGFSIVTWTGNGVAGASVDHGLGKSPAMIITKDRDATKNWNVYHQSLGATNIVLLNVTNASAVGDNYYNTTPTSSVFYNHAGNPSFGSQQNINGNRYVSYLWAEIPGFSKFGSYTGNNSTDGPVVITGFRPRWIIIKCSSSSQSGNGGWRIFDTERDKINPFYPALYADTADYEVIGSPWMDILSNGFKIRSSSTGVNAASPATYIYAAFAEAPAFNLYGGQANAR